MRHLTLAFLVAVFLAPGMTIGQVSVRPLLESWQFRPVDQGNWMPAEVPGTVHTDMLHNKAIPDPFYRQNEESLKWMQMAEWEYRVPLNLTDSERAATHQGLILHGLDTYADVYVNGRLLLQADNMFRSWKIDLHGLLNGVNDSMRIFFRSPIREAQKLAAQRGYKLPADNDTGHEPLSIYVRKAGYHFGWDWGPRTVTAGIWRPVELQTWNDLKIDDLHVQAQDIGRERANMKAQLQFRADFEGEFQAEIWVDDLLCKSVPVMASKGSQQQQLSFFIPDPELWWPNGAGMQNRYRIEVRAVRQGKELSRIAVKTGLRKIRLVREQEGKGESFAFEVNGRRIFMKGTNYIPPDHFLPRASERKMQLLRDMHAVNMNMVRVWGGGVYEDDAFYDMCDSLGILVWQDMMFAGGMYPLDDPFFLKSVRAEVEEQVKRLRNHPSLALWCGNNEIEVAWKNWGWQEKYGLTPDRQDLLWKAYVAFFQENAPQIIRSLQPDANYVSTSPLSNWGHPDRYNSGSMHDWSVWHGGYMVDSLRARAPRFAVEYGFQSFPMPKLFEGVSLPQDLEIDSEWLKHRQKSYKGNQPILDEINRIYGPPADFQDFCVKSQLVQARALGNAIEAHRMSRPHCMGTLYWQLDDCWQGPSWSTIDFAGNWKAGQFALQRLYAPVLLDLDLHKGDLRLRVASDRSETLQGSVIIRLMDFQGKVLKQAKLNVNLPADSAMVLYQKPLGRFFKAIRNKDMFLAAELVSDDEVVAEDILFLEEPKNLNLPERDFGWGIEEEGGNRYLVIRPKVLLKDIWWDSENTSIAFGRNFMDMIPGRIYKIPVIGGLEASLEDLGKQIRFH